MAFFKDFYYEKIVVLTTKKKKNHAGTWLRKNTHRQYFVLFVVMCISTYYLVTCY